MVSLTHDPVDASQVLASVASSDAGAVVLFLGTTREHTRGRRTASLDYECYPEMAERKLAGGEIGHAGSALMAWCVSNARIEDKGNAILVTKAASGKAKIDPLMAGFNAVSLMALNPKASKRTFKLHTIG